MAERYERVNTFEGDDQPDRVDSALASLVTPLLECAICLDSFKDPLVLPCLHSFCCRCLGDHISSTKDPGGTFRCPSCRKRCTIPKGGLREFPKNYFANSLNAIIPSATLSIPAGQIQCKHSGHQTSMGHGKATATVFCTQCDAYLCENCNQYHRMFDLKDHVVISVEEAERKDPQVPRCHRHRDQKINWYCKTCLLPSCSDCILESHKTHDMEKLSEVADRFRKDLRDVSKQAEESIVSLQLVSDDIDCYENQMEEDLDQVTRDISRTANNVHTLVRQRQHALQDKVKKAREDAQKHFKAAKDEVKTQKDNMSKVRSCAQSLCAEQVHFTFRTVLQAPGIKQQFLQQQQQGITVKPIEWNMKRQTCQFGGPSADSFLGDANMTALVTTEDDHHVTGDSSLWEAIQVYQLQYTGFVSVSGVAPIHKHLLCITHNNQRYIWVYNNTGELKKKVEIPGVNAIWGMAVLDGTRGKLAFVDNTHSKVHLVTLSFDLEVMEHVTKEVPFVANRLSVNTKKEIVICYEDRKNVAVLRGDGVLLREMQLNIPGDQINITSLTQTSSGYAVCECRSNNVYFTAAEGDVLHTANQCKQPWSVAYTSWGHVIVAGCQDNTVKVFTEEGDFVGHVRDSDGNISVTDPEFVHLDDAERRLYVGCGAREVRVYKCPASRRDALSRTVRKLDMSVKLATL